MISHGQSIAFCLLTRPTIQFQPHGPLASLSSSVPAGYQLSISLQSDSNDAGGNITAATFVVIDSQGNTLPNYPVDLEKYGAAASEQTPIISSSSTLSGQATAKT